jgi:hypothetical protein
MDPRLRGDDGISLRRRRHFWWLRALVTSLAVMSTIWIIRS